MGRYDRKHPLSNAKNLCAPVIQRKAFPSTHSMALPGIGLTRIQMARRTQPMFIPPCAYNR
ncbi:hypothetical protein TRIP_B40203 [uncultured Desulfatiglans sp.]|uniref:Uncharacterized protein n=1 Tax=Uncultured Desulfatiglans sp. TaxID=1748965 RepID=A0A653AEF6_UNCDX|nr:hypothetical protein TRIP_B40203 [uncultured Desulfatiglans sp.]